MPADPTKSSFQKLCDVGWRLMGAAVAQREHPCVVEVVPGTGWTDFPSGAQAILYAEFKLQSTAGIDWIIEIESEPQWNVLAGIRLYRTSYEERLGDLGEWTTSDSDEVVGILEQAITLVEESISTFDFCQY
jgi:hypothetical protein